MRVRVRVLVVLVVLMLVGGTRCVARITTWQARLWQFAGEMR